MMYIYVPNQMARRMFNIATGVNSYTDARGLTPLLESAIGRDNYERYIPAQDPLCGGGFSGQVDMVVNPDEKDLRKLRFQSIGTVIFVP